MTESDSIFSKFKKADAQYGPAELPPPPPPPPHQAAGPDPRVAALQEELRAVRLELEALKNRPAPAPAPAAAPADPGAGEFAFRLGRAEELVDGLRRQVAACEEGLRAGAGKAVSREELGEIALRVADLGEAFDGLKRSVASEGELAARLGQAEAAASTLKAALEGQQRRLKTELEALAPRSVTDEMRVNLAAATAALDEMKRNFLQYSEELSSVAAECRRSLGEAQGLARVAAQGGASGRFDEHMKDVLAKLNGRLSEAETAMHAGIAELTARLNSGEVLYNKVFSAAEERLAESMAPRLKDIDGQLSWLRETVIRLSDDYTVVAERKMRALEAKYSAFEVISRRMDAIDAALKKSGRIGLP